MFTGSIYAVIVGSLSAGIILTFLIYHSALVSAMCNEGTVKHDRKLMQVRDAIFHNLCSRVTFVIICGRTTLYKVMYTSIYTRVWDKSCQLFVFFCLQVDRSWRNIKIYEWKWMVLGALGCMNNVSFEKN